MEINRVRTFLHVQHSFPLAGGGIGLHLFDTQNKLLSLEPCPVGSFGSRDLQPHLPRCECSVNVVYAKQVPNNIDARYIVENTPNCLTARHMTHRSSGKPLRTVKIVLKKDNEVRSILFAGCSIEAALQIFTAKVRPLLERTYPLWCASRSSNKTKVVRVHKLALLRVSGAYLSTPTDSLEVLLNTFLIQLRLMKFSSRNILRS